MPSGRILVGGDMLGIGYSDDRGEHWKPATGLGVNGNGAYEIGQFTKHPVQTNIVWAGSMSGPLKSIDGGQSWVLKRNGMPAPLSFPYTAPVDNILIDPANPDHMLCFGGSLRRWKTLDTDAQNFGAVWESSDGGDTWSRKSDVCSPADPLGIVQSVVALGSANLTNLLASVSHSQGVWKSTNGGTTWTQSVSGLPHNVTHQLVSDPADATKAYVALRQNGTTNAGAVYKTTNAGTSWTSSGTGLPSSIGADANNTTGFQALVMNGQGDLFTADVDFSGGEMYRLEAGETVWEVLTDPTIAYPADTSPFVFAADPDVPTTIWGGTSDTIIKTIDNGANWTDQSSKIVGTGYGGRGFSGLLGMCVAHSPYSKRRSLYLSWDAGAIIRTNDAQSFTFPNRGYDPYDGGQHAAWATKDIVYAIIGQNSTFNGLGVSTNGGVTWTWKSGGALMARFAQDSTPGDYCVRPISADGTKCLAVLPNGTVYQTTDTGANWSTLSSYTAGTARWIAAASDFSSLYICDGSGVRVSTDLGANWSLMSGSKNIGKLYVDPTDKTVLYGVGHYWRTQLGDRGLWRYESGSWTQLNNGRYVADVAIDRGDPDHIIICECDLPFHDINGAEGIKRSLDRGATFTKINDGLPMLRVATVRFDPFDRAHLVAGTYGRGFVEMTLPGSTADVPDFAGGGSGVQGPEFVPVLPEGSGYGTVPEGASPIFVGPTEPVITGASDQVAYLWLETP